MKRIEYLSPSGLKKFKDNPEDFYLRYLSIDRPDEEPQTQPMSVGSAFDAFCKSYLHEKLFGKGADPKYQFENIFQAQVQPHVRDFALEAGQHCFNEYRKSGALTDLLLDLQQAVATPRFEIEIKGTINGYREGVTLDIGGITLLGKPDVFYINKDGAHVILDWKVNGYCSKYPKSPMPGYVRLRGDGKKSGQHKDCNLFMYKGTMINGSGFLEQFDQDWATQLSIYAWLCGAEVGEEFITGIDQLCCAPSTNPKYPNIRIAEHRCRVTPEFQWQTFALAQHVWEICYSDHFFRDMSKEDSQARCLVLDQQAQSLRDDPVFANLTRPR